MIHSDLPFHEETPSIQTNPGYATSKPQISTEILPYTKARRMRRKTNAQNGIHACISLPLPYMPNAHPMLVPSSHIDAIYAHATSK